MEHETARPAIVHPDRRAVGAEQHVGAVAEQLHAANEIQRRRQLTRELVEQRADITLKLLTPAQM